MESQQRKRAIVILVYLAIFIIAGYFFYSFFKPEETCSDNIKNQNEEDVDCGGVCAKCNKIEARNLEIGKSGILPSVAGAYDFWAEIMNPNNTFGSSNFKYKISIKDASGNVLAQREAVGFILPGERKYVVENNIGAEGVPASAEMEILDSTWVEFNEFYERPQVKIVNKNYNEVTSGVGFSEAKGLLKNESPYDFSLIKLQVILRNTEGYVIALNSTEMRTVKSGEDREFKVLWPNQFPGIVSNMEAQAEVNIFDSQSFLQQYFKAQKFQEYPKK